MTELIWEENSFPALIYARTEFGTLGIRLHVTGEYSISLYQSGEYVDEITRSDVGLGGFMILGEGEAKEISEMWLEQQRAQKGEADANPA